MTSIMKILVFLVEPVSSAVTELLFSDYVIAPPLRKSVAKDGHFGTRKTVIIDISGDEEHPATNTTPSAKAIMKNLPQDSISGDFPRFREGSVYIIIDPRSSMFQYRLHRTTLSRVSPLFAKFLRMNWPEASEALKTRATDAYARFDLRYSYQHKKWVLTRTVSRYLSYDEQ